MTESPTESPVESPTRHLARRAVDRILAADPFAGTALGLRQYDALLPDPSAAAAEALAGDLAAIATEARALAPIEAADRTSRDAIVALCEREQLAVANRAAEYTVTAMPITGPPVLFAALARAVLSDVPAADDYRTRVRGATAWLDSTTERLREGAARSAFPVGALLDNALSWVDRVLAAPVPPAILAPTPPEGWAGVGAWHADLETIARDAIVPALARWREVLVGLRASARGDEAAGVHALPGGPAIYERASAYHTTLPLTADELHRIGRDEVARLEERARELGARLGLGDLDAVRAAVRVSTSATDPQDALRAAQEAVRRAEARAGAIMPQPLPGPCAVSPMPATVAESGMAPHYTRPREDGSRPGTYWFNTLRPTAGTGWDLEAVAFHETVPGHHSQLARLQRIAELPLLQQLSVTVHSEGWGLYAERLAGEFGLYSGVEAELGAVYIEMHRAARLVVDTGLHALGWSRTRAHRYLDEHVALAPGFLADEVDRYIAWPGQALAYLVGQREILRLRAAAEAQLGAAFDLPTFNGVLLDQGSLPLPVLARVVEGWLATPR